MRREFAFLALVILSVALAVHAQVTTGAISGTVKDATGAVVPDATVVLLNEDTGISRTVPTDTEGRYSASSLSLGRYRVTASREGFQTGTRSGIDLTLGRNAVVDFELAVGAVAQTVEVTGEAALVQTTDSTVGYLVEDRTIRELPLNGRDITQLIFLNPGVTAPPNSNTTKAFAGYGPKISISGFRSDHNAYLLDGSYLNDFQNNLPSSPGGAMLGVETVREFQVLTTSYSAQYGRALGGVFSAVSKSGTNERHGSAYEYLRNSDLDARNFFDRRVKPDDPRLPAFRRNQFGATFSGPIKRDKSFFFVAYEGFRESLGLSVYSLVPDLDMRQGILAGRTVGVAPVIAPFMALYPLPTPQGKVFGDGTAEFIFVDPQPAHDDFGQGRFDHQFSEADSFFVRFTADQAQSSYSSALPESRVGKNQRARLLTLSETHILSPRALGTLRFSVNRINPFDTSDFPKYPPAMYSVPSTGVPPTINPGSGIVRSGPTFDFPFRRYLINRFTFQNDMSLTLGSHSLKYGGTLERLQFNLNFPSNMMGSWSFRNLQSFLQGIPNRYQGTPPDLGNAVRGFRQWILALYFEDGWQVTPRLTLNVGLRWDPYTVPTEAQGKIANLRHITDPEPTVGGPYWRNKSWRDFGPRLGFAWTPFEGGKTSVRGGTGLYYIPNGPYVYRSPSVRNIPFNADTDIADPRRFPDAYAAIAAARAAGEATSQAENISFDNFKTARALQYNLSVQQQMGASTVLMIGYVGSRGINLASEGSWNQTPPFFNGVSLEVPRDARKINPNFAGIFYVSTRINSWYNGMTLSLQRRFSKGLQTAVSYTFSRAIAEADSVGNDRTGSGGDNTRDVYFLKAGKALSSFSQKNVLRVNYSYDLPLGGGLKGISGHLLSGWQLTGIVSAQSGQPFAVAGGGNLPAALQALDLEGYTRLPNADQTFQYSDIIRGGPEQYFNPLAFTLAAPYELGNVGRNTLIGPGLAKWDAGITKNTALSERWRLQFRAEFFNLTNRVNFARPSSSIFGASGSRQGSAGRITSTVTTPRQIQFGLKLTF